MDPIWTPSEERIKTTRVYDFIASLNKTKGTQLISFDDLYEWSIAEPEAFWRSVWSFVDVIGDLNDTPYTNGDAALERTRIFPKASLNYAENLLRHRGDSPAIHFWGETHHKRSLSWNELYEQVSLMVQALRSYGVGRGDRVAGFMPNMPETIVAMLATASIGAIWSS
ncbi:MAG: AMP-binding protein, partial [Alphaproteobacteria bacterium]|nr:AMP-binding protein [Alphaproteobacteria bacterium]